MSIPFRERNPVPIGAAGLASIGLVLYLAFNIQSIPFIGGGNHYRAAFTEAGGLIKGDDVRIAGVKVGKVENVDLAGSHVEVDFKVTEPAAFGDRTGASIRMKTLLGAKYLALEPAGGGQLKQDSEIPLDRTVSSYDIVNAFSDLATTSEEINTDQLATSLTTLATEFRDSPPDVKAALDGLSRLSTTIASRDGELKRLLASANNVSGTVAQRNKAVESIIKDSDLLLVELNARREAIHTLFTNTSAMAQQLTGLVRDNRSQLKPALDQLTKVLAVLEKHEKDLGDTITAMGPFTRLFANVLGNGRWFDTYIQNLTTPVSAGGH
ncbi:phospholipid/cholesterol/gamma-HCH transport system substrate-binding protein [Phycicoccus badiiscoriae]|uniref:Phospholipid/cholesterol/gamma-HCH transport system substrate-binding protein n=1 Tax=Pedococcus badiiscoriae TaxID=642776 RepID=A0A852WLL7_9MICO|nr:MlaD family protein [Pedococcus badiiscoriae]NYG06356.1 phospholipid/cholesterol/gamma-HCH transport system substrate-binding protein [Pedococcus badiiscoriae]